MITPRNQQQARKENNSMDYIKFSLPNQSLINEKHDFNNENYIVLKQNIIQ